MFRPEAGEDAVVTYGQPPRSVVRPELGSGTARSSETRDIPEQMCGLSAAGSRPALAATGGAATCLRVRRAGVPPS